VAPSRLPDNQAMKSDVDSLVQFTAVPFGINLLRLGRVRRRHSTPVNADPLSGMTSKPDQ
jgi:hypothetical protein